MCLFLLRRDLGLVMCLFLLRRNLGLVMCQFVSLRSSLGIVMRKFVLQGNLGGQLCVLRGDSHTAYFLRRFGYFRSLMSSWTRLGFKSATAERSADDLQKRKFEGSSTFRHVVSALRHSCCLDNSLAFVSQY